MSEQVFFDTVEVQALDIVNAQGLGRYSGQTLEQIAARYNTTVEVMSSEKAMELTDAKFRTPPKEITKEDFWHFLEVLPPEGWVRAGAAESFKLCERTCGSITLICVRLGQRYFSLHDDCFMRHDDIVDKVREAFPELP